jgi:hypothetical protein
MRYGVIDPLATIEAASSAMRLSGADTLLIVGGQRLGSGAPPAVSARDIVTGIVALGLDPRVVTVSDLLSVIAARRMSGNIA